MSRWLLLGVLALALLAIGVAWLRRPAAPRAVEVEEAGPAPAVEVPVGGVALAPEPRLVPTLQPIARFGETRLRHPSPVRSLALSSDGRFLATTTASEPVIRLWDVTTARLVRELRVGTVNTARLSLVGIAPEGAKLVAIRH